jgi:hypothetical protein
MCCEIGAAADGEEPVKTAAEAAPSTMLDRRELPTEIGSQGEFMFARVDRLEVWGQEDGQETERDTRKTFHLPVTRQRAH